MIMDDYDRAMERSEWISERAEELCVKWMKEGSDQSEDDLYQAALKQAEREYDHESDG